MADDDERTDDDDSGDSDEQPDDPFRWGFPGDRDLPHATVTTPDGETHRLKDVQIDDVSLEHSADAIREVSSGLLKSGATRDFQLSVEVPVKELECPNCDQTNSVPVWSFVRIEFDGQMDVFSGYYALGHTCVWCGYPH
jgi:hypothetical protein